MKPNKLITKKIGTKFWGTSQCFNAMLITTCLLHHMQPNKLIKKTILGYFTKQVYF